MFDTMIRWGVSLARSVELTSVKQRNPPQCR